MDDLGKFGLATLYSDRTREHGDNPYIRLREYIEVIGRQAKDDRYVAGHPFCGPVTLPIGISRRSSDSRDDDPVRADRHVREESQAAIPTGSNGSRFPQARQLPRRVPVIPAPLFIIARPCALDPAIRPIRGHGPS